jgi:EAL domain-containing protein (putative c-di-GMP-specific phosphodiesterase class I)
MFEEKWRSEPGWFLEGPGELGKRWLIRLHPLPFVIGRHQQSDLCLSFTDISRKHAQIIERGGRLWIIELGSTNGTFVNRERINGEHPLVDGDVLHFCSQEFRVVWKSGAQASPDNPFEIEGTICKNHFELPQQFSSSEPDLLSLLRTQAVTPHFQPVVSFKDNRIIAYELLGRGNHPGLPTNPLALLALARGLGKEVELSELFRSVGIQRAADLSRNRIYFNTIPAEMDMTFLRSSLRSLRGIAPDLPLAMEVHEAAVANPEMMRKLRQLLNELDMQLLYDDFGAGQARLLEIIKVPPDILKFDICLIKGIHLLREKERKAVQSLLHMSQDLGIMVLAEGIEVREELEACVDLGFDLGQGYYMGKPSPNLPTTHIPHSPSM